MIKLLTLTALLCGVQTKTISVNCVKNLRTCLKQQQKYAKIVSKLDRLNPTKREKVMLKCIERKLEGLRVNE